MVFPKFLKLPSLLFILFSFCSSDWIISTNIPSKYDNPFFHLTESAIEPLLNFSVQLLCSSMLWFLIGTFKVFLISLLSFSLCSGTAILTSVVSL